MTNNAMWKRAAASVVVVGALALAVYSAYQRSHYMLATLLIAALSMVPFYIRFERKRVHAREIVFVALLTAIAAVSRVPFSAIPSVQPTSFIIIISGLVLGAESGFMIGATSVLVSNMFLGQGAWTPFQMFCWGMMGYSAGLLRNISFIQNRKGMVLFGLFWGFLFGWLMNLTSVLNILGSLDWIEFVAIYTFSFYFDLAHALTNVVLLWFFGARFRYILTRFCTKYGFFTR